MLCVLGLRLIPQKKSEALILAVNKVRFNFKNCLMNYLLIFWDSLIYSF